jgi:hypothetical protein
MGPVFNINEIYGRNIMTYYRLAIQTHQTTQWTWKTTAVTSLQAVFQLLSVYRMLPQDDIRVFTASSEEELSELLKRHNTNLASSSVTATQFLRENNLALPEPEQSASEQSISAPAAQQDASVAARAKAVWDEYVTRRAAQIAQQGATVNTSSSLCESITTTGATSSSDMSVLKQKRLEMESGPGGDHDAPYRFAFPISMKERLAWIHLQRRVQAGELPA